MEKNNFNRAYICIIAIFAIGVAISNIISFFGGVGFALIGAGLLLAIAIVNILKDENNKKRFGDIFVLLALEFVMLVVLFFAYDFNINGMNKFPLVVRNMCAIYSLLASAYVMFRYVSEIKGKKYNFVEYMLGNYTPASKPKKEKKAKVKLSKEQIKKNKELENGTLEPKPSSVSVAENSVETQPEDSIESAKNEVEQNGEVEASEKAEEIAEVKPETSTNNDNKTWY